MKLAALICSAYLENMQNIFFITLLIFIKSEIEINITVQSFHTCESGGKELSIGIRILLGILVNHYWYIDNSLDYVANSHAEKKILRPCFKMREKEICALLLLQFSSSVYSGLAQQEEHRGQVPSLTFRIESILFNPFSLHFYRKNLQISCQRLLSNRTISDC